jgi:hypothetical protein
MGKNLEGVKVDDRRDRHNKENYSLVEWLGIKYLIWFCSQMDTHTVNINNNNNNDNKYPKKHVMKNKKRNDSKMI